MNQADMIAQNINLKRVNGLYKTLLFLLAIGFSGGVSGQSLEETKRLSEQGDNVSASSSYQRNEYISSWADEDGDCQNLRHEMLIRNSQLKVTFTNLDRCSVNTGRWFAPYSGKFITRASDLDVDHVIPLAYAHANGAASWSRTKKQSFAIDETNLLLVDDGENQFKGAKGPSEYLPREEFQCEYADKWQLVSSKYKLELPASDARVLLSILTACADLL